MVFTQTHTWRARAVSARLVLALSLAAGAGALAAAGPAGAALEHLGLAGSSSSIAPSCPSSPCEAITATTGFQAAIAGTHNAMTVQKPGHVTSWSITLGAVSSAQQAYFTKVTHGPARAGLVILRQGASYRFRVADAGPVIALGQYFGRTTSFDLARPLPVLPGEIVALSVPTWAPALAVGLDKSTGWRASRSRDACADLFTPSAQTLPGALTKYLCVYRTARLTYGATVADNPTRPASKPQSREPGTAPKKSQSESGSAGAPARAAGAAG